MPGRGPSIPKRDERGADVAIIGDGVIGLSTALALARLGATCCIIGQQQVGAASSAAAGLLAPTIGVLPASVRPMFHASLDLYPELVESLREFDPGLAMLRGLIEVFHEPPSQPPNAASRQLRPADVRNLEPRLSAPLGGLLHPKDGAIDNVRLVQALRAAVTSHGNVRFVTDNRAVGIATTQPLAAVILADGRRVEAPLLVIAAGAWSPFIDGLPRTLPVSPLKGQMLALDATGLQHAVMGRDVYLVPREGETIVGATTEHAGFDTATTAAGIDGLRAAAQSLWPELLSARLLRAWAGIRPATPDMLPIIGPDPEVPSVLYACGHSKNGILLAPATALVIAALAHGRQPGWDIAAFSVSRFSDIESS